jgi:hypothetical protein
MSGLYSDSTRVPDADAGTEEPGNFTAFLHVEEGDLGQAKTLMWLFPWKLLKYSARFSPFSLSSPLIIDLAA